MKDRNNLHHVRPRSRGGNNDDNVVSLPRKFHETWHYLFGNMTVDEVHRFIDIIMQPNRRFSGSDIQAVQNFLKSEVKDEAE